MFKAGIKNLKQVSLLGKQMPPGSVAIHKYFLLNSQSLMKNVHPLKQFSTNNNHDNSDKPSDSDAVILQLTR